MNEKTPTPTPTADNTAARLFRELAADMNDEQAERALRDLLFARWPFLRPDPEPPKPCPNCANLKVFLGESEGAYLRAKERIKQLQDQLESQQSTIRELSEMHKSAAAECKQLSERLKAAEAAPFRFPRYGDRFRVVKDKLEGYGISPVKVGDIVTFSHISATWPNGTLTQEEMARKIIPALVTRMPVSIIPFACLEYVGPENEKAPEPSSPGA